MKYNIPTIEVLNLNLADVIQTSEPTPGPSLQEADYNAGSAEWKWTEN